MSLGKVTFCNSDNYKEEYGMRYHCHFTGYAYYIIDDVRWLIDSRTMKPSTKYEDMKRRWIEILKNLLLIMIGLYLIGSMSKQV